MNFYTWVFLIEYHGAFIFTKWSKPDSTLLSEIHSFVMLVSDTISQPLSLRLLQLQFILNNCFLLIHSFQNVVAASLVFLNNSGVNDLVDHFSGYIL